MGHWRSNARRGLYDGEQTSGTPAATVGF